VESRERWKYNGYGNEGCKDESQHCDTLDVCGEEELEFFCRKTCNSCNKRSSMYAKDPLEHVLEMRSKNVSYQEYIKRKEACNGFMFSLDIKDLAAKLFLDTNVISSLFGGPGYPNSG
ncbi:unnamed protein product, partial [Meganyctiphanes norvegica]